MNKRNMNDGTGPIHTNGFDDTILGVILRGFGRIERFFIDVAGSEEWIGFCIVLDCRRWSRGLRPRRCWVLLVLLIVGPRDQTAYTKTSRLGIKPGKASSRFLVF
jgi:hypothetical protein